VSEGHGVIGFGATRATERELKRRRPFVKRGVTTSSNARLNQRAWDRMSVAERETGCTVEQLDEVQRRLRAQFYAHLVPA
jgi:hypothetical protein